MKRIYLTFDYEPFLGSWSGTTKNSVLTPTTAILESLNKAEKIAKKKVTATFFVDTTWLLRLHAGSKKHRNELLFIAAQLLTMLSDGHSIGLHLHPSWLDAEPAGEGWQIPAHARFRIDQLNIHEVRDLVNRSVALLNEIILPSFPDFRVLTYRAGGLCAQPFSSLESIFIEQGIFIDSSVAPGLWANSTTHRYDYRNASKDCIPWAFQENPAKKQYDGLFTEYPIAVFTPSSFDLIINKLIRKIAGQKYLEIGDGVPAPPSGNKKAGVWQKLLNLTCPEPRTLSLEQASPYFFKRALKQLYGEDIVVLSHPKFYTQAMSELILYLAKLENYEFCAIGKG